MTFSPRPAPLRAAMRVTCIHEGWAQDAADADALLIAGKLKLSPAQDRGCVTPLAAIISAGTPLFEVREAGQHDAATVLAPAWRQWLADSGPIGLWRPAQAGLLDGDDLHNRCTGASRALVASLPAPVRGRSVEKHSVGHLSLDQPLRADLAADGRRGLAGRGIYEPPLGLFRTALDG